MRDGIDCDDDLLELADETSRIVALIDDPAIRARLIEIAGELREFAAPLTA